ncbi:hypothetical protein HMPREF1862_00397 [Varibaculum cambriense]|uniref:Uncharacterized protein n=1 Tax=Varibaculum cambriense TaxID=184870 RepID=A0AB34X128_9ACTO|nr:hypothetical protein HMPREF1862_00397 [Varibaculum cambriense]
MLLNNALPRIIAAKNRFAGTLTIVLQILGWLLVFEYVEEAASSSSQVPVELC